MNNLKVGFSVKFKKAKLLLKKINWQILFSTTGYSKKHFKELFKNYKQIKRLSF